ncbi:aminoglycoside phosphotransferase [Mycobacterium sp. ACS4331]|uniref:aminoglycoside phosphotransferase n=1 Tax=Mycobacterium sp. ACS4331 TaxID=1834121 RepID=UPI0007FF7FE5|nr:aminoglycoside phosphotransferase [Mycobacterium sp. ACS4331]OBF25061.1 aminoglycoside phosphotransferase [Mycobacterium sp. ACS4331]
MLTPDDLAGRTSRAVAAATAAATDLGLTVESPRVLHDMFSVIVHLAPSPVVARVPTVLPQAYLDAPDLQTAQQCAELAVARWLADRGCPVVGPSPLVPREPVPRDGFSITFWGMVEEMPEPELDLVHRASYTARLHAELREYDGSGLGFWTPFGAYIPASLAALEHLPGLVDATDLARAQREWEVLAPVLTDRETFEAAFPGVTVQPIHGDAPYYNMIPTADGLLWSDFEMVCVGAVESDLAMAGPEAVAAYDAAATELGLRHVDQRVLRLTETAGQLASVAVLAMATQLPMLVEAVAPVLDAWRQRPEVTEIA